MLVKGNCNIRDNLESVTGALSTEVSGGNWDDTLCDMCNST